MSTKKNMLVVGGGMVGGTVAKGLADQGFSVRVIERQIPPDFGPDSAPDIRVSAINLASEAFLRQLGIWPHIEAQRLHPYRRLAVWEKLGRRLTLPGIRQPLNRTEFHAEEVGTRHLGYMIENLVIQRGIWRALEAHPNVELITGHSVTDLLREDERITGVTLDDGQTLRSDCVIAADGALSRVRTLAGLGLREDPYSQHAMVIAVAYRGAASDITWQAFTPHGPLAFLPLCDVGQESFASLVWYDSPQRLAELKSLPLDILQRRVQEEFPEELPPLTRITQVGSFPLVKRHAKRYVQSGLALIGDAAHTINPLAGQGVNLGFQDATALLQAFAEAPDRDPEAGFLPVLENYERQRRMDNLLMMTLMDSFYYLFSNDVGPLRALRNLGLGIAQRTGPGKRKVLEYATGLNALPGLPSLTRQTENSQET